MNWFVNSSDEIKVVCIIATAFIAISIIISIAAVVCSYLDRRLLKTFFKKNPDMELYANLRKELLK